MPADTDVVIAGAGPNGLMVAGELALAGIRATVLDPLPEPSPEPKANGLVGQVVRLLDMRGLYQEFSGEAGPPPPSPGFACSGIPVSFSDVPDNPMRTLFIPQPQLVRRLHEWVGALGVAVRWGQRLFDVTDHDGSVVTTVDGPTGHYAIESRYLVAADGGRSTVRKKLRIGFPGTTTPMVLRLAHVTIPPEYRNGQGTLVVPAIGSVPQGHNRFDGGGLVFAEFEPDHPMIGTIEFVDPATQPNEASLLDDLRASVKRVLSADIPLEPPRGPGPHALRRIDGPNTRLAERYRDGNIFLVGDAAHVHSAMGGPGLNLGLQDAANLGWKLAATINGYAPPGLLDTYFTERYPVAERVMTQSMAQVALMAPGPEVTALRNVLAEIFGQPGAAAAVAHLLAGSDIRYATGDAHRLSGFMVPDWTLGDGRPVAELLHSARPVLLDTTGGYGEVLRGWRDRIDVVTANCAAAPTAVLIRPDGYVAWATASRQVSPGLQHAAHRWFGTPHAA
jgi:2-polyprenyl-6-methoxyphenol hydroxylase-like FAD-dependent oxidoreductase